MVENETTQRFRYTATSSGQFLHQTWCLFLLPIDTAAKEREIEEKLDKQKPEKPQNRSRTTSERSDDSIEKPAQKSGNSIFGGARYELLLLGRHQK